MRRNKTVLFVGFLEPNSLLVACLKQKIARAGLCSRSVLRETGRIYNLWVTQRKLGSPSGNSAKVGLSPAQVRLLQGAEEATLLKAAAELAILIIT